MQYINDYRHKKGFTIIELIVVFAILALLVAISVATFSDVRNKQVLKVVSEEVFGMLLEAQGDTLAARDGLLYGVHIEATSTTFFEGSTYSYGAGSNIVYIFKQPVIATTTDMIGSLPIDIVFTKLNGVPDKSGTLILSDQTGFSSTTIRIYPSGLIEYD